MHPANVTRRRRGFTLIELLVVIAIISVLMGLTSVAAMKFLGKGPETQNRIELGQMEASIAKFRMEYNVDYIPSRIRLREDLSGYTLPTADGLDKESRTYLEKLFTRNLFNNSTVDWDADGTIDSAPIELQGQECLVFFLGGRMDGVSGGPGAALRPNGFATGVNPMGTGVSRKGPYYEFKPNRLVKLPGRPYYSYLDVYGTPIAYFSHNGRPNGYTTGAGDCAALNVSPYHAPVTGSGPLQYIHPDGFQVVSAGYDKQWGTVRELPPAGIPLGPDADNVSNFVKKAFRNGQ